MDIFGIGPTEFLFVIIILLLVFGPKDLVQLGRRSGQFIRKLRESETWTLLAGLARALRKLPNTLAEEAGTEEILREVVAPVERVRDAKRISQGDAGEPPEERAILPPGADRYAAWTTPAAPAADEGSETDSGDETEHSVQESDG